MFQKLTTNNFDTIFGFIFGRRPKTYWISTLITREMNPKWARSMQTISENFVRCGHRRPFNWTSNFYRNTILVLFRVAFINFIAFNFVSYSIHCNISIQYIFTVWMDGSWRLRCSDLDLLLFFNRFSNGIRLI